jgi:hypothetical protein
LLLFKSCISLRLRVVYDVGKERPSRSLGFSIREAQEKLTVFLSKAKASTGTYHPSKDFTL